MNADPMLCVTTTSHKQTITGPKYKIEMKKNKIMLFSYGLIIKLIKYVFICFFALANKDIIYF